MINVFCLSSLMEQKLLLSLPKSVIKSKTKKSPNRGKGRCRPEIERCLQPDGWMTKTGLTDMTRLITDQTSDLDLDVKNFVDGFLPDRGDIGFSQLPRM